MLVQVQSLSKQFGPVAALTNCTLSARQGEVLGLLGPNGAGKTTLLRLLLGFLKPTAGSAAIDGLDCYRQAVAVHQRLTYLPGEARMFPHLTGQACLDFFAQLRAGNVRENACELARRLDLNLARRVRQMSTGMRQKLALAVALAPDVPLAILDEPTANLDPNARRTVLQLVREARDNGKTVLFSSHVLSEVEEVCDSAALLRDGQLVQITTIDDVKRRHRIYVRLTGPLAPLPAGLTATPQQPAEPNSAVFAADGELAPLLSWLSEQPIAELRIEAVGLSGVYQQVHGVQ